MEKEFHIKEEQNGSSEVTFKEEEWYETFLNKNKPVEKERIDKITKWESFCLERMGAFRKKKKKRQEIPEEEIQEFLNALELDYIDKEYIKQRTVSLLTVYEDYRRLKNKFYFRLFYKKKQMKLVNEIILLYLGIYVLIGRFSDSKTEKKFSNIANVKPTLLLQKETKLIKDFFNKIGVSDQLYNEIIANIQELPGTDMPKKNKISSMGLLKLSKEYAIHLDGGVLNCLLNL